MKNELSYRSETYILKLKNLMWRFMSWLFRIEISGIENIPQTKCLLIANHNSGAILESHSLLFALTKGKLKIYGLNHQALFKIPLISSHFRKIGAVTASREVAKEVLNQGHQLLIFPGGNHQAFRPLSMRNKNSFPWAKGWADIALETSSPVVPIKFIGSHNANPIFISSSLLSKVLVIPWLLKIRWFPVSLAQIVLSGLTLLLCLSLELSLILNFALTYLAFCFTPLVPSWPARIHIKIYPAIDPSKSKEDLCQQVNAIMDADDTPKGDRQKYPLNGVERFMLLHESSYVKYNSQFIFDFTGDLNIDKFLSTTDTWIDRLPHLRSVIVKGFWRSQRYIYKDKWFEASDIVSFSKSDSLSTINAFCSKGFALHQEAPVRFLIISNKENKEHKIIFSCHHSLADGAAQAFLFEEWSLIYNGEPTSNKFLRIEKFRYKSIHKQLGLFPSLKLLFKNLNFTPPRSVVNVATLVEPSDSPSRTVSAFTLKLPTKVTLRKNFYELVLNALNETLKFNNDYEKPILVIAPIGLRWLLKVKSSLQNILVSYIIFLPRKAFSDGSLKTRIETKFKTDPIIGNIKFLFGTLPLCALSPEKKLKKQFKNLDNNKAAITSSILLVSAPIPRGFTTPNDWHSLYISARGTLLRSPSLGVVYTGKPGFETVTIEFIPGLISNKSIETFISEITSRIEEKSSGASSSTYLEYS